MQNEYVNIFLVSFSQAVTKYIFKNHMIFSNKSTDRQEKNEDRKA